MTCRACLAVFLASIGLVPEVWCSAAEPARPQKNVLLIVADDLGFQIGCYGDPVARTPHLDRLAASGTRFTHAFCTTASCSASRSVILSGQHNHANGQYGHEHAYHHFASFDTVKSLPVVLAAAGYRTCSIGKFHVAPEAVYHFERYENQGIQGARNSVRMAENAARFLAEADERPFFLYYCSSDPHRGGPPGEFANQNDKPGAYPGVQAVRYDPVAVPVPPWLPDRPETRRELAEYYQAVSRFDQGVGGLLDALDATGHADDTLVLFLSDNGPPFPGSKTNLYEPGMNLPLLVRMPGQKNPGGVNHALVNWADLMPTILQYASVAPSEKHELHGRSFLAVLDEERPAGWDEVYASHTFHEITMYYPMRVVRTPRYKYLLNLAHPLPFPFASDLYESPVWQATLREGQTMFGRRTVEAYVHRPRHELYDLESDPLELVNLADDPGHAEVLRSLRQKLKDWQKRTGDPWVLKYEYE